MLDLKAKLASARIPDDMLSGSAISCYGLALESVGVLVMQMGVNPKVWSFARSLVVLFGTPQMADARASAQLHTQQTALFP